ncbi:tyrosine kinase receptor Cad96Ca [Trichogramma pretiosum]|uniref:tyrosine kinase receptor Cad96Ca n=1 Tax=Trichogramma pretiosum TaxID=7493 RepID=UPI0006C98BED|nr:tyrosine kinase receptor Cad96Ca [Trichogramma pretiosum]
MTTRRRRSQLSTGYIMDEPPMSPGPSKRRSIGTATRIVAVLLIIATFSLQRAACHDNTPPTVYLNRNWVLSEDDPVGKIVERVRAEDNEQDELSYGLEPSQMNYQGLLEQPHNRNNDKPLPFDINNTTGIITLNQTLKGRAGQHISLYVTVSDGQLTAKSEVFVNIEGPRGTNAGQNTRSPFANHPANGGIFRPPLLRLPTLTIPPSPNVGQMMAQPPMRTRLQPETIKTSIIEQQHDRYLPQKLRPQSSSSSSSRESSEQASEQPPLAKQVPIDADSKPTILGANNQTVAAATEAPGSRTMSYVLLSAVILVSVVLLLGVALYKRHLRATKELSSENSINVYTVPNKTFDSRATLQNDKWEFPRHRLKILHILGEGCFGQVWRCEAQGIEGSNIHGLRCVAVKTLKENATERERLDLAQELKVMKGLEPHPNVVRLLGCCTERDPLFIILEYVSGGKLQSFLRASREERNSGGSGGGGLTSHQLTMFVYQVAKGMEYLASKGIIHRDLAARNVLIDEKHVCKVADFGFARDVAANQIYERKSEGRLPIRWMAPESLWDNIFSVKSDIWSFGVLIWEIVTLGSTPYPGLAAQELMKRVREGYRLERPEHCKRELYNIMFYCWNKDPSQRPSFTELVARTEELLLDETDYIELDRFPDHSYYNVLNLSGEKL